MSLEQSPLTYSVASFVGAHCLGNRHLVCVNPQFRSTEERQTWLSQAGDTIVVFVYTKSPASVEFYRAGRSILRCGSGTLAAAHVLFRELFLSEIQSLDTTAGPVAIQTRGDYLGYGANGLPLQENEDGERWQALVNQPIASCWHLGGDHDYCLLEFGSEQAVADLSVDTETMCHASDRALIATARATTGLHDYVLRYFAPQHGQFEDAATGSANLQLASFWQERLGKTQLKGCQLSQAGGEFFLDITDDCTWVMGRTRKVASRQSPVAREKSQKQRS